MTRIGMLTRKGFLANASAFALMRPWRVLAVPPERSDRPAPNLRFGVISDLHVVPCAGDAPDFEPVRGYGTRAGALKKLEKILGWYRERRIDALMVTGDIANNGLVEQMQLFAEAFEAVFPRGRGADGRKVEKLFVTGNHDWDGENCGSLAKRRYPDPQERARHLFAHDLGGNWEKVFGEKYEPIFLKRIRGYVFIGQHWDGQGYGEQCRFERLKPFLLRHKAELDPSRPFFYFQHPHLKNTCYGPWAWGHDLGLTTETLSQFPNAVAFSGHSHYSVFDERAIWQGGFTAIGTGSLLNSDLPRDERPPLGYENTGVAGEGVNKGLQDLKTTPAYASTWDCQSGLLVDVYDDAIEVRRREFCYGLDSDEDWIIPTDFTKRPYGFRTRAQNACPPEFVQGAELDVSEDTDGLVRLTIPGCRAKSGSRVYSYEVAATGRNGECRKFHLLAEGFNVCKGHYRFGNRSRLSIRKNRLPDGCASFAVAPLDCWGNRGRVIEWRRGK